MENEPGAGYEKYIYPSWSQILGWLIFILCIIPIPLVYLVNYIKEYRKIEVKELVRIDRKATENVEFRIVFRFSQVELILKRVIVSMNKPIMRKNLVFYKQLPKIILLDSIGVRRKK